MSAVVLQNDSAVTCEQANYRRAPSAWPNDSSLSIVGHRYGTLLLEYRPFVLAAHRLKFSYLFAK